MDFPRRPPETDREYLEAVYGIVQRNLEKLGEVVAELAEHGRRLESLEQWRARVQGHDEAEDEDEKRAQGQVTNRRAKVGAWIAGLAGLAGALSQLTNVTNWITAHFERHP